jgi:hypothetical protein
MFSAVEHLVKAVWSFSVELPSAKIKQTKKMSQSYPSFPQKVLLSGTDIEEIRGQALMQTAAQTSFATYDLPLRAMILQGSRLAPEHIMEIEAITVHDPGFKEQTIAKLLVCMVRSELRFRGSSDGLVRIGCWLTMVELVDTDSHRQSEAVYARISNHGGGRLGRMCPGVSLRSGSGFRVISFTLIELSNSNPSVLSVRYRSRMSFQGASSLSPPLGHYS